MPRRLNSTLIAPRPCTRSRTSWKKSRSAVTITASSPASLAWIARVPIASSASWPAIRITGIRSTSSTSSMRPSWGRKSVGASARPALYSASSSRRTVGAPMSKATAIRSGCSSPKSLINIDVNPYTAFVTVPELVARVCGSAKNARYARL